MSGTFYTDIIFSKDGFSIPVKDNIAFHSKYAPVKEAQNFVSQFSSDGFFIVFGLCGGYHIEELNKKFPDSKILAVEASNEDLKFLEGISCVQKLAKIKNIKMCSLETLAPTLISNYIPATDGNLTVKALRAWETCFNDYAKKGIEIINEALKTISADYSVQKHFGKIWQRNIIENLSLSEYSKTNSEISRKADTSKIAAIIAAGPGLNSSLNELKTNRDKYFIISTDTAYSTLDKSGICCDAVVSVDGQMISHRHYMHTQKGNTVFVFDLCSNSAAVRKIIQSKNEFMFIETGHPLSSYASHYDGNNNFIHLNSGSGTVTIAAISLADTWGFNRIKLFGADFSYINGLPYAKGTYLDGIYRSEENRINTAEKKFTHLLYRTEVIHLKENKITTEVLNSYSRTMQEYMNNNGFILKDDIYLKSTKSSKQNNKTVFNFKDFKEFYKNRLNQCFKNPRKPQEQMEEFITLLPYCASLGENSSFIAYSKTLSYTDKV